MRASPAGVRSMLVKPGVLAGAGVAPIGVRRPARRAAMCGLRLPYDEGVAGARRLHKRKTVGAGQRQPKR